MSIVRFLQNLQGLRSSLGYIILSNLVALARQIKVQKHISGRREFALYREPVI